MSKLKDLTGFKTGCITVLERYGSKKGQSTWLCKCSCGKIFVQYGGPLRSGKVKSCGHLYNNKKERQKIAYKTIAKPKHGGSGERLYFVWGDMRSRCQNPKDISYSNYGSRGIKVCEEWENDYSAFRQWAIENGYDQNAKRGDCTLDRIDVNGDYCPDNCRWLNMSDQCANKRNTCVITYNGKTLTASEWSKATGIPRETIYSRYKAGWQPEKIFSHHKYNPHKSVIGRY